MQAQLWALNLLQCLPVTLKFEDHCRLHAPPTSCIQYSVDCESYAYQLALDMGTAPSFSEIVVEGWKMTTILALSANVNTKFRLVGPWKWDDAESVMKTEIWETVARRRGFFGRSNIGLLRRIESYICKGHFTLSVMPIAPFGTLSAVLYVFTTQLAVFEVPLEASRAQLEQRHTSW